MSPNRGDFVKSQVAEAKAELKAATSGTCGACKPLQHLASLGADVGILVLDSQIELKQQIADTDATVQARLKFNHDSIVAEIAKVRPPVVAPEQKAFGLPVTFLVNLVKAVCLVITAASAILALILMVKEVNDNKQERIARHIDSENVQQGVYAASASANKASKEAANKLETKE